MREEIFTKDMERLDAVKESYLNPLMENVEDGNEIFFVYAFLRDIFLEFQRGNEKLLGDHKACLQDAADDCEKDKDHISARYDNWINQRKEQAHTEIEKKRTERDEKISASDERLNKALEQAEEIRNTQLSKLKQEREELSQKFLEVKEPDKHHFFIKSKRREYSAKHEEYRKLYEALQQEISLKEESLRKKIEAGVDCGKKKNSKLSEKYKDEFQSFKVEEMSAMERDIERYEEQKRQSLEALEEGRWQKVEEESRNYAECLGQRKERLLNICRSFLTDQRLSDKIQEKKARQFDFGSFCGVERMPVYLDQGYLSCQLDADIVENIPEEVMEAIWKWMDEFNCARHHGVIKLPNVRKECLGTAYFLAMDTNEHVDYVRMLVFSILMQYPADKMDLVMFNPEMSGCFTGLEQLGGEDGKAAYV